MGQILMESLESTWEHFPLGSTWEHDLVYCLHFHVLMWLRHFVRVWYQKYCPIDWFVLWTFIGQILMESLESTFSIWNHLRARFGVMFAFSCFHVARTLCACGIKHSPIDWYVFYEDSWGKSWWNHLRALESTFHLKALESTLSTWKHLRARFGLMFTFSRFHVARTLYPCGIKHSPIYWYVF